MIDPHVLDLINLDIDGALDAAGKAELRKALDADPAAREMDAELRRLVHVLETSVPVEPPGSLQPDIVAALPRATVLPFGAGLGSRRMLPVRIAAAIAATIALVFLFAPSAFDNLGVRNLRGTMRQISPAPAVTAAVGASDGDRTSVRLELHAAAVQSIELQFDADAVRLERVDGTHAEVREAAGSATIVAPEGPGLTLVLHRLRPGTTRINIRVAETRSKTHELGIVLPSTN